MEAEMGWLDSGEDISHLLRGNTYGIDTPLTARGPEPAFELLFLIVICGVMFACFAVGAMYAWESRFARIEEEVAKKEESTSEKYRAG
jgi:hypothetical protein